VTLSNVNDILQQAAHHHQQGQLEKALEIYLTVIEQASNAQAYYLAGNCLAQLGEHNKAIPYLISAIDMDNRLEDAYLNLAICQEEVNQISDVKLTLSKALDLFPQNKRLHNRFGNILKGEKQYEKAIGFFLSAIRLDHSFFPAYVSLAQAYEKLDRLEEARDTLLKTDKISPGNPIVINNLANILRQLGHFDKAKALLLADLKNETMKSEYLHNLGKIEQDTGNFSNARSCYLESLLCDPNSLQSQWNLGLLELGMGLWEKALDHYRIGRVIGERPSLVSNIPEWNGETLTNKHRLLIVQEQGIGEELMFANLYQYFSKSPASIHATSSERLIDLLSKRFPNIVFHPKTKLEVLDDADYDFYVFSGDLPWLINKEPGTSRDMAYAKPQSKTISESKASLRIGISWRGGKNREEREKRSISLNEFLPIIANKAYTIINLQHDASQEELDLLREKSCHFEEHPEIDLKNSINTIASLIDSLDVVICCTNSVAHIAGFINKNCYMLTPQSPTWYWMFEGDKSIWYPSLCIIRQKYLGNWKDEISTVSSMLESRYSS
jgi:Tfp pilus assembly protein PilF